MVFLETAVEAMVQRGKIAENLIASQKPELIELFLTYQNEALAARKFLQSSLIELDPQAEILEVGGGILALAIQLASEGFKVTTCEPVGEGFTEISFIMNVFTEIAKTEELDFNLILSPIEECKFVKKFDFIFSINVMEHLKDPFLVLLQMVTSLKSGGKYRFFCPNYDFPYEPHFGKWIFSRRNNAFYLQEKRAKLSLMKPNEALGLYRSLNFITLKSLSKFSTLNQIQFSPNHSAFYNLLERVIGDKRLGARHGALSSLVRFGYLLNLHLLTKLVPSRFQPIMDVETSILAN